MKGKLVTYKFDGRFGVGFITCVGSNDVVVRWVIHPGQRFQQLESWAVRYSDIVKHKKWKLYS
tara:strand:+ start:30157 stop:30345 length:189 start_codon:yes stop_codon:yes gene_type:complete